MNDLTICQNNVNMLSFSYCSRKKKNLRNERRQKRGVRNQYWLPASLMQQY